MRISDWSSDVCASDLVRIWAGGKYAHRNLDAREISDFFRWRIMGLFSIAAPPAVDVSKGGGVAAIRYCRIVIPPLPSPVGAGGVPKRAWVRWKRSALGQNDGGSQILPSASTARSEERRVGKECVCTCRYRW